MVGRLLSQRRWAATATSASAAATSLLPIMGFKDPLDTVVLLIAGIVLDFGYRLSPRLVVSIWGVALLGALAHAVKPIAKVLASAASGFPYPSLISGLAYPLALHALFGAVGAILAVISIRLLRRGISIGRFLQAPHSPVGFRSAAPLFPPNPLCGGDIPLFLSHLTVL